MTRNVEGRPIARFYQVAAASTTPVLTALLFKLLERGLLLCLLAADENHARQLDTLLWRQPLERFLPHGLRDGDDPQLQPLLISPIPDDSNGATVILSLHPDAIPEPVAFDVIVDFVEARNPTPARTRYRAYQTRGYQMEYWIQSPQGGWHKHGST